MKIGLLRWFCVPFNRVMADAVDVLSYIPLAHLSSPVTDFQNTHNFLPQCLHLSSLPKVFLWHHDSLPCF